MTCSPIKKALRGCYSAFGVRYSSWSANAQK